jgi:hypothetical protein
VIDWAEAEIAPFGLNLHSHQRLISKVHLKHGWIRYDDYLILEEIFWSTFNEEAGGLSNETIRVIKLARIMGLLLSRGFRVASRICLSQCLSGMMRRAHTTCAIWTDW